MRYPMITGHTGNDGTPANSIESIKKSISQGADAFEVDIRKDKNSILVLSHDALSQSGYDACPRLADALEIAAQHSEIRINCDLKDDDLPLMAAALAQSYGIGADRLILTGTVTPAYLAKHPEVLNMADIYLNAELILKDFFFIKASEAGISIQPDTFNKNPWRYIKEIIPCVDPYIGVLSETCLKYNVKGINIPYACLTDKNIKHFREYDLPVSAWTVNDETEMARLFSRGVENITTRCVEKAKSVRLNLLGF